MKYRARNRLLVLLAAVSGGLIAAKHITPGDSGPRAHLLESMPWPQAEGVLTPQTVVVIPIGAASKEHGPHLPLSTDFIQAEYFKRRVLEEADVVVAPTMNYSYYPAFLNYPGSTTLRMETARDCVVDVCRSLSRYGPRRFYVINIGISTNISLNAAKDVLAEQGIVLAYTDLTRVEQDPRIKELRKEARGTHANEVETSIMLHIAPDRVDMSKAAADMHDPGVRGMLSRDPAKEPYSPTGIYGDATLGTAEKGRIICGVLFEQIMADIEAVRSAALPERKPQPPVDPRTDPISAPMLVPGK